MAGPNGSQDKKKAKEHYEKEAKKLEDEKKGNDDKK